MELGDPDVSIGERDVEPVQPGVFDMKVCERFRKVIDEFYEVIAIGLEVISQPPPDGGDVACFHGTGQVVAKPDDLLSRRDDKMG